ncbi:putative membrane protein DUF2157 [Krasilnikovia cinnamomea]|uniref:Putative membrane protein DUF2157 n=1 Tax=Krasilnikovia cinnamomea TaxID=349313 RepID=A0A4Q7ZQJ2_9ACTN|nr:DUF2157 domain-containing protein [Krasilnikovia cinnamomea]RZU53380.1 putative membrane protein DUF2157 [Krasilnikovia cinnamomea]
MSATDPAPVAAEVDQLVDGWVSDGVVTAEQAVHLRTDLRGWSRRARSHPAQGRSGADRSSMVIEAMGYLGGAVIVVALSLVAGWYWDVLPLAARLALLGGAALATGVAGAIAPRGDVGRRLRAVLWLAACAGLMAFLAVLAADGFGWAGEAVGAFAAGLTAAVAIGLWTARPHPLQHGAVVALLAITAGAATGLLPHPGSLPGAAIWAVGVTWALLAWGGLLRPPRLGVIIGTVAAVIGAVAVADQPWGSVLALITVGAAVAAAVLMRDLVLLGIGSAGMLLVLPPIVNRYFPGVLAAALALLVVGLMLVAAAVTTARRRRPSDERDTDRDWRPGPARLAVAAAAVVAGGTVVAVLLAGG